MPNQKENQRVRILKAPTAFIPQRLEVADKPEYSLFPINVLFVSYRNMDGRFQAGSALYEPDLHTCRKEEHLSSMRYHKIFGGECYLEIDYDGKNRRYRGEKFVNGKSVGCTYGVDNWQLFFTHFTMLGLVDGERCRFEYWRTCWLAHRRKERGNRFQRTPLWGIVPNQTNLRLQTRLDYRSAATPAKTAPCPATLRTLGLRNEAQRGRLRGVAEELALVQGG